MCLRCHCSLARAVAPPLLPRAPAPLLLTRSRHRDTNSLGLGGDLGIISKGIWGGRGRTRLEPVREAEFAARTDCPLQFDLFVYMTPDSGSRVIYTTSPAWWAQPNSRTQPAQTAGRDSHILPPNGTGPDIVPPFRTSMSPDWCLRIATTRIDLVFPS